MLLLVPKIKINQITEKEEAIVASIININFNQLLDIEECDRGFATINYITGDTIITTIKFSALYETLYNNGLVDSTFIKDTARMSKHIKEYINKK